MERPVSLVCSFGFLLASSGVVFDWALVGVGSALVSFVSGDRSGDAFFFAALGLGVGLSVELGALGRAGSAAGAQPTKKSHSSKNVKSRVTRTLSIAPSI